MKVYLAGPITGCSYKGCTDWREWAKAELLRYNIQGVSPMRAKEYLAHLEDISADGKDYHHLSVLSLPSGIVTRDRFDCQRCDIVLANLLGATRVSVGTMIEFGWADAARRPLVVVMEKEGNPHEHAMVRQMAGYVVETLEEALHVVKAICS